MSDNLADILDDAMYISRREVFYSLINTNYFQVLIFYIFQTSSVTDDEFKVSSSRASSIKDEDYTNLVASSIEKSKEIFFYF